MGLVCGGDCPNWKKILIKCEIGNGEGTSFRTDPWCSKIQLSKLFPTINSQSSIKLSTVANNHNGNAEVQNSWFLVINEDVVVQERNIIDVLLGLCSGVELPDTVDRFAWFDGLDCFNVKEYYRKILECRLRFFSNGVLKQETVWLNMVSSKVCFLLWLLVGGKILTQKNLQQRRFHLASMCLMCGETVENREQLFVSYSFSRKLWELVCCPRRSEHFSFSIWGQTSELVRYL